MTTTLIGLFCFIAGAATPPALLALYAAWTNTDHVDPVDRVKGPCR